jgi:hypothetical protein
MDLTSNIMGNLMGHLGSFHVTQRNFYITLNTTVLQCEEYRKRVVMTRCIACRVSCVGKFTRNGSLASKLIYAKGLMYVEGLTTLLLDLNNFAYSTVQDLDSTAQ